MSGVAGHSGPPGNQNGRKGKEWQQAINRALEKRGNGDRSAALDALAEKFLDAIEEMTVPTAKRGPAIGGFVELADRIDGKSHQSVDIANPDGSSLFAHVERVIIESKK